MDWVWCWTGDTTGRGEGERGEGEEEGGSYDAATIAAQERGSSISTSDSVSLPPGL